MVKKDTSKILRGIAILIVIASHYAEWMGVENALHPAIAHAVSTWGPLGVDVFMLLSGYGLYKSADKGGVNGRFIWRRLSACYVPYLLVAFTLALITNEVQLTNLRWLYAFVTAQDYWFISALMVMYIAFMLCFGLFKKLRLPFLSLMVIGYSVWLYLSGHMDFWTLSNAAFLIGVYAAAAEKRFPALTSLKGRIMVLAAGIIGSAACYYWMQRMGGSGLEESYIAELVLNLFLTLAWLGIAALFPSFKPLLLGILGKHTIFIYLTHAILYFTILYRLPAWPYAQQCMLTSLISLVIACLLGELYDLAGKLPGLIRKRQKAGTASGRSVDGAAGLKAARTETDEKRKK